jgi:hypothetical protein
MKCFCALLKLTIGCVLACFCITNVFAGNLRDYLPDKDVQGHFMQVGFSERQTGLANKMMEAAKKNREWFMEAVAKAPPGEPVPYDEKLGLTREEYKEFLEGSKHSSLKEVLTRQIHVVHNADGSVSLDGGDDLKFLALIKFDPTKNSVSTPFGDLSQPKDDDMSKDGEGGALGPHKGISFSLEEGDPHGSIDTFTGKAVTLNLGTIIASGRRFIYYNVAASSNGKPTTQLQMILEY